MKVAVRVERWATWHEGDPAPRVDFLAPMQRRRLSPLARVTLEVMWQLVPPEQHLPTVFASRHGEVISTHRMLTELVKKEPLSPAEFSHSVHNAIVGQASIFRHDRSESVSVSAGDDTLAAGFLEAAGLLLDFDQVLVAAYDEPVPEPYRTEMPQENERWVVVALLGRGAPNLVIERDDHSEPAAINGGGATSRALKSLLASTENASMRQVGEHHDWVWSHHVVA